MPSKNRPRGYGARLALVVCIPVACATACVRNPAADESVCRDNQECPSGFRCLSGMCRRECTSSESCSTQAERCVAGMCQMIVDPECTWNADCSPPKSWCVLGACQVPPPVAGGGDGDDDGSGNGSDGAAPGDTASADTGPGDIVSGDTASGDTASGDTATGDTAAGDTASPGDPIVSGDSATGGDSRLGDPLGGDTYLECTSDLQCAQCESCIGNACVPRSAGAPCGAFYLCQDQVWGLSSDGTTTTCYARADVQEQCDAAGSCIPSSCASAAQGQVLASCDDLCADSAAGFCDPGDDSSAVSPATFCQAVDTPCGLSCDSTIHSSASMDLVSNPGADPMEQVCFAKAPLANKCTASGTCLLPDCSTAPRGSPIGWCTPGCSASPDTCVADQPVVTLSELCTAGAVCSSNTYCTGLWTPPDTVAQDACQAQTTAVAGTPNVAGISCQPEVVEGCVPYACWTLVGAQCRTSCRDTTECAFSYSCVGGFCE